MNQLRVLPFLASILVAWAATNGGVLAQIKTDGTVGRKTALEGPDFRIDEGLGKRIGKNLFYSFDEFNIRTLGDGTIESATFKGAGDIANVISRGPASTPRGINGLLRSEVGKASFWFINPDGVAFGPNAELDVPGSFHVSTADELRFTDGAKFSAAEPDASTLTVAPPETFGFLGDEAGMIKSSAQRLFVGPKKSVSVVGGSVLLDGSSIEALSGRINVVGIGGSGEVRARDAAITWGTATGKVVLADGSIL